MYDHEQRQVRGRAARINAEAFAAADDLLRSDLGRAYAHEVLAEQLGLSWGQVNDIEFVAGTLDAVATGLATGVDVVAPADRAAELGRAGWLRASDPTTFEGELAVAPSGVAWVDGRVSVVGCPCGQPHPAVAGVVWRQTTTVDDEVGFLIAVVADTSNLGDATLPTYVLDSLVLFTAAGMAANVPTTIATGSPEWATGLARWALHQAVPVDAGDS